MQPGDGVLLQKMRNYPRNTPGAEVHCSWLDYRAEKGHKLLCLFLGTIPDEMDGAVISDETERRLNALGWHFVPSTPRPPTEGEGA